MKLVLFLVFIFLEQIWAMDRAQVLPLAVNYAAIRGGTVDHLNQIYSSSGAVSFRSETINKNFDLQTINRFSEPETKKDLEQFTKTLETFHLSQKFTAGTLEFDIDPSVRYFAPIYARGLTDRWTMGLALPIINYKLNVSVRQVGSNVEQIRKELKIYEENSPKLKTGFDRLGNLVGEFKKIVGDRGYKPVENRDETFLGDVQLVSQFQLIKEHRENLVLKAGLILPTGPQDDPDDLTDLESQHLLAAGLGAVNDLKLLPRLTWGLGVHFFARLPDRVNKRVPENDSDILPKQERKDQVNRDLGDSVHASTNLRYNINNYLEVSGGLESGTKGADSYGGGRGWDYSVLAKNSYQSWNKSSASLEFSTVSGFLSGQQSLPFSVSYEFSDVFAGTNIERQQAHEIEFKMYF